MAGQPEIRGIYGWGVLISVAQRDLDRGFAVQVRYERRFGSPLLAATLKNHPRLVCCLSFEIRSVRTSLTTLARDLVEQLRLNGNGAPDMLLARRPLPFDVALSFAGEDRRYAAKLEELLRAEGLRVYFDGEEQSDL